MYQNFSIFNSLILTLGFSGILLKRHIEVTKIKPVALAKRRLRSTTFSCACERRLRSTTFRFPEILGRKYSSKAWTQGKPVYFFDVLQQHKEPLDQLPFYNNEILSICNSVYNIQTFALLLCRILQFEAVQLIKPNSSNFLPWIYNEAVEDFIWKLDSTVAEAENCSNC